MQSLTVNHHLDEGPAAAKSLSAFSVSANETNRLVRCYCGSLTVFRISIVCLAC